MEEKEGWGRKIVGLVKREKGKKSEGETTLSKFQKEIKCFFFKFKVPFQKTSWLMI